MMQLLELLYVGAVGSALSSLLLFKLLTAFTELRMYGWSACVNILNSCRYTVIMSTGCVVTIVWVFFKDIGESMAITSQYDYQR